MKNYIYNADYFEQWFRQSGITQAQLMKDLGVNNVSIKRWMHDKSNPLPIGKMLALCNLYDIDLSEFFLESGERADIHPRKAGETKDKAASTEAAASVLPDVSGNEVLLKMRIEHLLEMQRVHQQARDREETLRKEYQQREDDLRKHYEEMLEGYKSMVFALARDSRSSEGYGEMGYSVSDGKGMPHSSVNPQKR